MDSKRLEADRPGFRENRKRSRFLIVFASIKPVSYPHERRFEFNNGLNFSLGVENDRNRTRRRDWQFAAAFLEMAKFRAAPSSAATTTPAQSATTLAEFNLGFRERHGRSHGTRIRVCAQLLSNHREIGVLHSVAVCPPVTPDRPLELSSLDEGAGPECLRPRELVATMGGTGRGV